MQKKETWTSGGYVQGMPAGLLSSEAADTANPAYSNKRMIVGVSESMADPLPEFDSPPLSEVVLSTEFVPLVGWRSPHAGRYWAEIGNEYPNTEEQAPLASIVEVFGDERFAAAPPMPQIQFFDPNTTRVWFLNSSRTDIIQIQKDRFIVNWRRVTGDEPYPRYTSTIKPRFTAEFSRFKNFVAHNDIGKVEIRQCEVTYVNQIPKGEGWENFSDVMSLFSYWGTAPVPAFLPGPETLGMVGSFVMPAQTGRLHFQVQHAIRASDHKQIIQLQMTARGKPASSEDKDILAWFDAAREWVVRGFTDLTSEKAHGLWKRRV